MLCKETITGHQSSTEIKLYSSTVSHLCSLSRQDSWTVDYDYGQLTAMLGKQSYMLGSFSVFAVCRNAN